ncbi:MAG: hypothetical protein ACOVKP_06295, partial [Flavobacterium sp.]
LGSIDFSKEKNQLDFQLKEVEICSVYLILLLANGRYAVGVFLLFFRNVSSDIRNFPFDGFMGF